MPRLPSARTFVPWIFRVAGAALAAGAIPRAARAEEAGVGPAGLRCDWMADPLGVDSAPPRLSWRLEGRGRGERQTAWRVLVASSPALLAENRADFWDSGRVASDRQLGIGYGGRPLRSAEEVFWKVRVWDAEGRPSAWSAPARWTMGLLKPADWGASWITDPGLLKWVRPKLGFHSLDTADPGALKWVQLDLGAAVPIDSVELCALQNTVAERLGFPLRFRVEVANDPSFRAARVVADRTAADLNPWLSFVAIPAGGVRARYVRLTATRLRVGDDGRACLALSQIVVLSGGRDVARGAAVTASDSIEEGPWAAEALADGLGAPGANPRANETLLLRREFSVGPALRRALVFVCGLGECVLSLNGERVGDDLMGPGWTDTAKTCLYETHDVTALLKPGENAIGLCLAGGMYDVPYAGGRYQKFVSAYRPLEAILQLRLEYADGSVKTVATDPSWRAAPGPTTYAHVYGGEDYDARLENPGWSRAGFDAAGWTPAVETAGPGGTLLGASHAAPPVRAQGVLRARLVRELRPGASVYDLGQNAAVMPRIRVSGPAGSVVRIVPAELVNPDGSVDRRSVGGGAAYWQYTLSGRPGGETWFPSFFYHGARYLQVELAAPAGRPLPDVASLEGIVVHSASPPDGTFACSSELFDRIRMLVRWAQQNNTVSLLTDCPHRERLGWLEQEHLNGPSLRCEWDLTRLYRKTLDDMDDAERPDGLMPEIAPEYLRFSGIFGESPGWGSALVLAAWQQYVWTGDDAPLRAHYGAMQRYLAYLGRRASGGLVNFGLGDWYDLGPGRPGPAQLTPVALTATAFYARDAALLSEIAAHLGEAADARRYAALAQRVRGAFNRAFFHPSSGEYATGSETAQAVPLAMGLVDPAARPAAFAALVRAVEAHGGGLTSGDVGYRYLLLALAEGGRSDLIAAMSLRTDRPGYGYQLARGCTSLAEAWDADPRASQDHFMLGQIVEWFYGYLAGLAPDPAAPGFKRALVRPQPVAGVSWARASHESAYGLATVAWREERGRFVLEVALPPNTTAEVRWPFAAPEAAIEEGGRPAARSPGVEALPPKAGRPVFQVGSGRYRFTGPPAPRVS